MGEESPKGVVHGWSLKECVDGWVGVGKSESMFWVISKITCTGKVEGRIAIFF